MRQAVVHGEMSGATLTPDFVTLLALGANLTSSVGPPDVTLRKALSLLKDKGVMIRAVSRFFATPAFPAGNGPDYVNAVANVSTDLDAAGLLAVLHEVEAELGRQRQDRWGQRTLDIDLIACGAQVLPDAETHAGWRNLPPEAQIRHTPGQLILPHPRLQDRAFVLVPLIDVAPDWVHPVLGQSVAQMCRALDPAVVAAVRPIDAAN